MVYSVPIAIVTTTFDEYDDDGDQPSATNLMSTNAISSIIYKPSYFFHYASLPFCPVSVNLIVLICFVEILIKNGTISR